MLYPVGMYVVGLDSNSLLEVMEGKPYDYLRQISTGLSYQNFKKIKRPFWLQKGDTLKTPEGRFVVVHSIEYLKLSKEFIVKMYLKTTNRGKMLKLQSLPLSIVEKKFELIRA